MVHQSEMGPPPEPAEGSPAKPLAEAFPKGTKIKVAVLEIDADHKIRLSRAAVEKISAGQTAEAYVKQKAERELAERLLRSADKPARRPEKDSRRSPRASATPSGGRPKPEGQDLRTPRGESKTRGRPRPPDSRGVTAGKSPSLGTLGDLFKAKLAQKK